MPFLGFGLLEAFLIHVRLLDDFLSNQGQNFDSALLARDFLPTWDRKGFLNRAERNAINVKVAHLSTDRQNPDVHRDLRNGGALDAQDHWKRKELGRRALTAFTVFFDACDRATSDLFREDLLNAWALYVMSFTVESSEPVATYGAFHLSIANGEVTVWNGTSPLVVSTYHEGDAPPV